MKLNVGQAISAIGSLYLGEQQGRQARQQQDQNTLLHGGQLLVQLYDQQQDAQRQQAQFYARQADNNDLDPETRSGYLQKAQELMQNPAPFTLGPHEPVFRSLFGKNFDQVMGEFHRSIPTAGAGTPIPLPGSPSSAPRFISPRDKEQFDYFVKAHRDMLQRETDPARKTAIQEALQVGANAARAGTPYDQFVQQNPNLGPAGLGLVGPSISPDRKKRAAGAVSVYQKRAATLGSPEARQAWADYTEANPIPNDLESPDGLDYAEAWAQGADRVLNGQAGPREMDAEQRRATALANRFFTLRDKLRKTGYGKPGDYVADAKTLATLAKDPLLAKYFPGQSFDIPSDMSLEPQTVQRRVPSRYSVQDQMKAQQQAELTSLLRKGGTVTPQLERAWRDRGMLSAILVGGDVTPEERKRYETQLASAKAFIAQQVGRVDVPEGTEPIPSLAERLSGYTRSGAPLVDAPPPISEFKMIEGQETPEEAEARVFSNAARRSEDPKERVGMARAAVARYLGMLRDPRLDEASRAHVLSAADDISEEFGLPKLGSVNLGLSPKDQALLDHKQWERDYRNRIADQRDRALDLREQSLDAAAKRISAGGSKPGGGKWSGADAAAISAAKRDADAAKREWQGWIGSRRKKSFIDLAPGEDWHAWDPQKAAQDTYEMQHFPEHREGVDLYQAWQSAEDRYRRAVESRTGEKLGGGTPAASTPPQPSRNSPQGRRARYIATLLKHGVGAQQAEQMANQKQWR